MSNSLWLMKPGRQIRYFARSEMGPFFHTAPLHDAVALAVDLHGRLKADA